MLSEFVICVQLVAKTETVSSQQFLKVNEKQTLHTHYIVDLLKCSQTVRRYLYHVSSITSCIKKFLNIFFAKNFISLKVKKSANNFLLYLLSLLSSKSRQDQLLKAIVNLYPLPMTELKDISFFNIYENIVLYLINFIAAP